MTYGCCSFHSVPLSCEPKDILPLLEQNQQSTHRVFAKRFCPFEGHLDRQQNVACIVKKQTVESLSKSTKPEYFFYSMELFYRFSLYEHSYPSQYASLYKQLKRNLHFCLYLIRFVTDPTPSVYSMNRMLKYLPCGLQGRCFNQSLKCCEIFSSKQSTK